MSSNITTVSDEVDGKKVVALHYLKPIIIIASLTVARLASSIRLQTPPKRHTNEPRRYATIVLLCAATCTFLLQLGAFTWEFFAKSVPWPTDHKVVPDLFSVLVFIMISMGLVGGKDITWNHYVITWAAAFVLEVSLPGSTTFGEPRSNASATTGLLIHHARLFLFSTGFLTSWWFQHNEVPLPQTPVRCHETEQKAKESDLDFEDSDSDFDSECEDPEREKELKQQRMKRLQEAGNWITFLSQYNVFIPMVWPAGNLKLQGCIVFLFFHLMSTRILGVLGPRQLGIVTDKLTTGMASGDLPWSDMVKWLALASLDSELLNALKDLALLPLQQYAYIQISNAAFRHILELSMDFHNEVSPSELIRSVSQGQQVAELLGMLCFDIGPIFIDMTIAVVYISYTFDAYMVFIVILGGVGYALIGSHGLKWSVKSRKRYNLAMRDHDKCQHEGLNNWATVSQFNRGEYERSRYDQQLREFTKAEGLMYFAYNTIFAIQGSILTLARLAATGLAVYRVTQGVIPVGHVVTFTTMWSAIMNPITSVTYMMKRLSLMLTDSERLLQLLQTKSTVVDSRDAISVQFTDGRVQFDHVGFSYDPRKPTLRDVSFAVEPGMTVALVGETGGGKSTILKMLYRYYDVNKGVIRIDGHDIRDVTLDSLRDSFGMVPQDPALFNTTLMENLRYARLEASDEEVMDACRAACIHNKIMQFPDQYQCKVGERGVKLSGGEMQRVAIARAILRNPKIVLLDEATSMIDAETEAEIQEALKRLTLGRTTFVVAHRLSTIQDADLILVVNDGEIIERGTHEELFAKSGKYVALWSKQMTKGFNISSFAHGLRSNVSTPLSSNDDDIFGDREDILSKQQQNLRSRVRRFENTNGGER